MAFVAAKCPCCGAVIQIPSECEKTHCAYCGSHIISRAAVEFHRVEIVGQVEVKGIATAETLLANAETYMRLTMYNDAMETFLKLTSSHPSDWQGWWGAGIAGIRQIGCVVFGEPRSRSSTPVQYKENVVTIIEHSVYNAISLKYSETGELKHLYDQEWLAICNALCDEKRSSPYSTYERELVLDLLSLNNSMASCIQEMQRNAAEIAERVTQAAKEYGRYPVSRWLGCNDPSFLSYDITQCIGSLIVAGNEALTIKTFLHHNADIMDASAKAFADWRKITYRCPYCGHDDFSLLGKCKKCGWKEVRS